MYKVILNEDDRIFLEGRKQQIEFLYKIYTKRTLEISFQKKLDFFRIAKIRKGKDSRSKNFKNERKGRNKNSKRTKRTNKN